jgi:SAM-dependent methyltransferase
MNSGADSGRAKEFWENSESYWNNASWQHWLQHPKVQERLNVLTTGSPHKDRYQAFIERYFPMPSDRTTRVDRALTLGCGQGEFERGLAKYHFATVHDALDISESAAAEAARLAKAAGLNHVRYQSGDLNTIELPRHTYDVVFGISSVHHVAKLEHLFEQVALCLKPGGYFLLDEFIGPSQFQWTADQLATANEELRRLPEELRRHVVTGVVRDTIVRPTIAEMNAGDPSEAIRSNEIVRLLPHYFDVLEIKGYGGSVLHLLLEGICGNFDEDNPSSMERLRSLFEFEDRAIASGKLPHDFANIVARKNPNKPSRLYSAVPRWIARWFA